MRVILKYFAWQYGSSACGEVFGKIDQSRIPTGLENLENLEKSGISKILWKSGISQGNLKKCLKSQGIFNFATVLQITL